MAHLNRFSRNRCTSVEKLSPEKLRSTCRLHDNLTDAMVSIEVGLPELEIVSAQCRVDKAHPAPPPQAQERLQKVLGVRVGPGMLKIIKGLLGEDSQWAELSFMVEECCHGVILTLTKDELKKAPLLPEDCRDYFAGLVKDNIRLYNRCAAFAPGSSVVKDFDPPA
ncbi:MAG: hypothetical protein PVG03_08340 [Desulfarculaceae bacterium]|jgi:hypothetical protein